MLIIGREALHEFWMDYRGTEKGDFICAFRGKEDSWKALAGLLEQEENEDLLDYTSSFLPQLREHTGNRTKAFAWNPTLYLRGMLSFVTVAQTLPELEFAVAGIILTNGDKEACAWYSPAGSAEMYVLC